MLILIPFSAGAQNSKSLKTADKLYRLQNYSEAYNIYYRLHEYGNLEEGNYEKLGICAFQINKIKDCVKYLRQVPKENMNTNYFLGHSYHLLGKGDSAAIYYKRALLNKRKEPFLRDNIVLKLKQCQTLNWSLKEDIANVKQQVVSVNSLENELSPLFSKSDRSKLMFSSTFDPISVSTSFNKPLNHDVKIARYWDGKWTSSLKASNHLETEANERPICYVDDGNSLLFVSDKTLDNKLYKLDFKEDTIGECRDYPFFDLSKGDNDLYVYLDRIAVFASSRLGGYGGLDLFISYKKNDIWTNPVNLGSNVNSRYDEVSPFLLEDIIYFSSDRPSSIGGFDIFYTTIDDDGSNECKAMSAPINSPANDIFFKQENNTYLLASDRVTSAGKYDVYVFEKNIVRQSDLPLHKTTQKSKKELLAKLVQDSKSIRDSIVLDAKTRPPNTIKLKSLFYNESKEILVDMNIRKLRLLIPYLQANPHIILGVIGFDASKKRKKELSFVNVKDVLKELRTHMLDQGVNPMQLYFINEGGQYPYGSEEIKKKIYGVLPQFNRRIEFIVFMPAEKNIRVNFDLGGLNSEEVSGNYKQFRSRLHSYTYSVEVIPEEMNIYDKALFKYADISLNAVGKSNDWIMHAGVFETPKEARRLANKIGKKHDVKTRVILKSYGRALDDRSALYYAADDEVLQKWLLRKK